MQQDVYEVHLREDSIAIGFFIDFYIGAIVLECALLIADGNTKISNNQLTL